MPIELKIVSTCIIIFFITLVVIKATESEDYPKWIAASILTLCLGSLALGMLTTLYAIWK